MSSYYEKLLATGEVKCIDEEIPFEIPQGWEWCRLRDIILGTNAGKSPNCEKRPKKSEEWGVLTTTSIQENAFLSNENKVLPKHYVINPEHCVRYGDILITRAGPVNRTGIVCMVENNCDKLILSDKTVRIDYMHDYCNPKFLVFVLNSSAIHELVMSATVGMAASQVNVSQSSIQNTLIPFPPSKEQQRIINKLEALLPQIEKYDNAQNKLDELNKTVKDIIKKSVLQEAIQGKLVSQLEEEGTAKELLEQIKAEKQKLVKEGKLKKSALATSVIFRGDDNKYYEQIGKKCWDITEQIPFEIPSNWEWCRVRNVSNSYIGLTYKPTDIDEKGTIVLRSCNIRNGKLALDDIVRVSSSISEKMLIEENDIIICARNGSKRLVGKSALIRNLPEPMTFGAFMAICKTPIYEYMFAYLQSDLFFGQLRDVSNTTTINQLTQNKFNDFLIPIPPVSEQERIAFKISQLFQELR
jgi:type I restriction enzyme S subunit